MNCDAIVSQGSLAWLPRDAENLDVLHLHDIPLIGTFETHGTVVLFACLTGASSSTNVWAYLPLDDVAEEALENFDCDSTEELEVFVHEMFLNKRAAFAMASDGRVTEWSSDEVDDDGVLRAAINFMNLTLAHGTPAKLRSSQLRRAEQARADATRQVLEPA